VERGKVIAEHTLIAFGGAAPLHAARLAEKLGIARIIVPPNAGVGSAVGFLRAPIAFEVVRSRHMRLSAFDPTAANDLIAEMRAEGLAVVRAGAGSASLIEQQAVFMRYVGQGHEIVVPLPARDFAAKDAALLRAAFQREYVALFSRAIPRAELEIMTWSLTVSTEPERAAATASAVAPDEAPLEAGRCRLFDPDTGNFMEAPVYWRSDLAHGARLSGPAIIAEDETTTFVTAAFDGAVNSRGCIVLERRSRDG
jgi:N-methylhydantoinase A